jgi:hypothetical protein
LQILDCSDGVSKIISIWVGRFCFSIDCFQEERVFLKVFDWAREVVLEIKSEVRG